jgi:hypothetical protein
MNPLFVIGTWILCGCICAFGLYCIDADKEDGLFLYNSKSYMMFMIIFWPVLVILVSRVILEAIFNPRRPDDQ